MGVPPAGQTLILRTTWTTGSGSSQVFTAAGTYQLQVRQTDAAGNVSGTGSLTFPDTRGPHEYLAEVQNGGVERRCYDGSMLPVAASEWKPPSVTTRDIDRGDAARREIVERSGSDDVEVMVLDLASVASIRMTITRRDSDYRVVMQAAEPPQTPTSICGIDPYAYASPAPRKSESQAPAPRMSRAGARKAIATRNALRRTIRP